MDCALFDPPRDKVLDFGLRTSKGPTLGHSDNSRPGTDDELLVMKEPPIKRLPDVDKVAAVWKEYYDDVISELHEFIDELGERYLKPQGIDVHDLMKNTLEDPTPRVEKRAKRLQQIWDESQQYIFVDEHTTKEDVHNAFRIIAASQSTRPSANAPELDRVVCVDAALLHDEYGLTFKDLAERYGWQTGNSVRRVKNCVVRGRKILEEA